MQGAVLALVCFLMAMALSHGRNAVEESINMTSRATPHHVMEVLFVVDYSFYKNWYDRTTASHGASRQASAIRNIKEYVGALIHSSNKVYESLLPHNIYITIKIVDVVVMTTAADSPWTENVKFRGSPKYEVDPTRVLPTFQPHSVQLQRTIPHDHAMLLTMYSLGYHSSSGTFSGYAYTDAECKAKSVSIVEDNEDFYTAQLIAHELGHSLGCEHDGTGNSCPTYAGYAMEASFILANKKKWTFSSCSVTYIRDYLHDLNSAGTNCLLHTDNHHPSAEMAGFQSKLFGQVYSGDAQCKMKYGTGSYLCRDRYHGNFSEICLKLRCYQPDKDTCYYIDGGDGLSCGDGKWCVSDECVSDPNAPRVTDSCAAGDQSGSVKDGQTCTQLHQSHPTICTDQTIKIKCCATCAKHSGSTSTSVSHSSIDSQCVRRHGSGSRMCRGGGNYDNASYADVVCSDLQCLDPSRSNWCLSSTAEDGTPCGYKKWCQNTRCVHDSRAPAVPDTCPWGNQQGVATYGLTCDDIKKPEHHWRCYDTFTSKVCCASCDAAKRAVSGCQYGDKSDWCASHFRSQYDRTTCYYGHNTDLCCETCAKYANTAHIGCEYGDRSSHCDVRSCGSYDSHMRSQCCETCRTTAPIVG